MNVTLLTHRAGQVDDLTDDDYRDIYDELRQKMTLRQFVSLAGEQPSRIAWWSKYERSECHLSRAARNALRRAVGMPELAFTVVEAVASVDVNAAVWQIGDSRPADRVLVIGVDGPLRITLDGDAPPVAGVPSPKRIRPRNTVSIPDELWRELNARRQTAGQSWPAFLARLIENAP